MSRVATTRWHWASTAAAAVAASVFHFLFFNLLLQSATDLARPRWEATTIAAFQGPAGAKRNKYRKRFVIMAAAGEISAEAAERNDFYHIF